MGSGAILFQFLIKLLAGILEFHRYSKTAFFIASFQYSDFVVMYIYQQNLTKVYLYTYFLQLPECYFDKLEKKEVAV
ncbi:MAG TPA: hypothetical protein DCR24_12155 [Bacillus bacterium]|nr:hypothetical protein [Bacillus sp. (in: firmicutes)]